MSAHDTPTVLKKIVARKWEEIAERKPQRSEAQLLQQAQRADAPRGFVASNSSYHACRSKQSFGTANGSPRATR